MDAPRVQKWYYFCCGYFCLQGGCSQDFKFLWKKKTSGSTLLEYGNDTRRLCLQVWVLRIGVLYIGASTRGVVLQGGCRKTSVLWEKTFSFRVRRRASVASNCLYDGAWLHEEHFEAQKAQKRPTKVFISHDRVAFLALNRYLHSSEELST